MRFILDNTRQSACSLPSPSSPLSAIHQHLPRIIVLFSRQQALSNTLYGTYCSLVAYHALLRFNNSSSPALSFLVYWYTKGSRLRLSAFTYHDAAWIAFSAINAWHVARLEVRPWRVLRGRASRPELPRGCVSSSKRTCRVPRQLRLPTAATNHQMFPCYRPLVQSLPPITHLRRHACIVQSRLLYIWRTLARCRTAAEPLRLVLD